VRTASVPWERAVGASEDCERPGVVIASVSEASSGGQAGERPGERAGRRMISSWGCERPWEAAGEG
jgi:hypothetical protein